MNFKFVFLFANLMMINQCVIKQRKSNALLIHNVKNFRITHSDFLRELKKQFQNFEIKTVTQCNTKVFKIKEHKIFKYDLIVLIASRNTNIIRLIEDLQLTEFYDNGGNIAFLSDSFTLQTWRISLNLFGFDQYTPSDLDFSYDSNIQQYTNSKDIFIPKKDIYFQEFSRDIKDGIYYTGGLLSLTPYESSDQWSFLSPNFDTVLMNKKGQVAQNKELINNNLVVGAQNKQNLSRILVVGSFKIFSNDYFNKSNGDNFYFARNLMNWVDFKNHVLDLEYYSICSVDDLTCKQQTTFKPYDKIYVKLRILDDNGEFYQDEIDNIYIRMKMMDIYLQQPLKVVTIDEKKYYTYSFEVFDKIGIYKISLVYQKPGFYLDSKQFEQEIIIKYKKPQVSLLKNIPSLLYLIAVFIVSSSALYISLVIINNPKSKQF